MSENNIKLSRLDRLVLSNQLRILEALYPDEANDIAIRREALERGYEMLYEWDMDYIYGGDDVMTSEESSEVWNTLDMFDSINRAANNLGMTDVLTKIPFATFRGYDGNNETKFMAFAAYTVERLKRFEHVKLPKIGYFNSHAPVRGIYQRMLKEWRKVTTERRFELTKNELKSILDAAPHR
jgi:uncharacterized protein YfbU (UPF0304 family)